jgi:hypothetical protein
MTADGTREMAAEGVRATAFGGERPLTLAAGARLSRLLLAKATLEALFVAALFVVFSYSYFNPRLRGSVDLADERAVEGWAVDESEPARRVEVQLFIDGRFVAQRTAADPRPDVLAAGRARDAGHGFRFAVPPLPAREREYEARVFALHESGDPARRTLQQIGETARFRVAAGERNRGAREDWWREPEQR